MDIKQAERILSEFPNTHGYDLSINEDDEEHRLVLRDGIVTEDITEDSPQKLRSRIQDWIETSPSS